MFFNNKRPNHPFCSNMHNKMLTLVDFELSVRHILAFIIQLLLLLHLFYHVPQWYCVVGGDQKQSKKRGSIGISFIGWQKKKRVIKLLRNCCKHLFANAKFTVQDFSTKSSKSEADFLNNGRYIWPSTGHNPTAPRCALDSRLNVWLGLGYS